MEYIILLVVLSSLVTMVLCFQSKKEMIDAGNSKRIKLYQIYISSLLCGAPGAILAYLIFDYRPEKRYFLISQIAIFILQTIILSLFI